MNSGLLSVIVPVYNVYPYLECCVQSLLAQTYHNLEIILIDDGSTDGSGALCDTLAAGDDRIIVIHQANAGVSVARNAGLGAAGGNFIGFVDPDDWCEPEMFANLISLMEQDGSDAAFCGFWEDFEEETRTPFAHTPAKSGVVPRDEAIYQCILGIGYGYSHFLCTKCFRRRVIYPNGTFLPLREGLVTAEDELYLAEIFQNICNVSLTPQMYYHWRQRSNSASHRIQSGKLWENILNAIIEAGDIFARYSGHRELIMARIYDVTFQCIWMNYYAGDKTSERYYRRWLKAYRSYFYQSAETSLKKKVKYFAIDWMCRLRFPKEWVKKLGNMTSKKLMDSLKNE